MLTDWQRHSAVRYEGDYFFGALSRPLPESSPVLLGQPAPCSFNVQFMLFPLVELDALLAFWRRRVVAALAAGRPLGGVTGWGVFQKWIAHDDSF